MNVRKRHMLMMIKSVRKKIRDVQAGKKNVSVVEGITLEAPDEALNYERHLTMTEIRLLVLNRILNQNVVGSKVPQLFIDTYIRFPEEKRKKSSAGRCRFSA